MTIKEHINKIKKTFVDELIEIEDMLIHDRKDDALAYIMNLLKALTNEINE